MSFNHYAKLKRIISEHPEGWYIKRIDQPTVAKNFKGETRRYDYYYRLYNAKNEPIMYGKFQQLDRLATALDVPIDSLPVLIQSN
jgi:hypothetical protein